MRYVLRMALLAVMLIPGASQAASFDCKKATLPTEIVICLSDELSAADDVNATIFYQVREAAPRFERSRVNHAEREWLALRNACGASHECVSTAYADNMGRLCGMAEELGLGLSECEED